MAYLLGLIRAALVLSVLCCSSISFAATETQAAVSGYTLGSVVTNNGSYSTTCDAQFKTYMSVFAGKSYPTNVLMLTDLNTQSATSACHPNSGSSRSPPSLTSGSRVRVVWTLTSLGVTEEVMLPYTQGYYCPDASWTLQGTSCVREKCLDTQYRDASGVCQCPANQTLQGGVCKTPCPAGYHNLNPDNGTCEKDCIGDQVQQNDGTCKCDPGSKNELVSFPSTPGQMFYNGNNACANGCQYKLWPVAFGLTTIYTYGMRSGSICGSNANVPGLIPVTLKPPLPPSDNSGTGKDGATPDPLNTPPNNSDPVACGNAGGSWGSYNGVSKCLTPDSSNPVTKREGSGETKNNPDGSKSVTQGEKTTTCDGGSCAVETKSVTKDGNGNVTGSSSGSGSGKDAGSDFCDSHPNSIVCKPGAWSGSCDQGFTCDGDAVICATAKAVWEHRCVNKWAETENELSAGVDRTQLFGDEAKAAAALNKDGSKDWDLMAKFSENRKEYLKFASSCAMDLSFDFKGQHYVFDTSILCQIGLVIKVLLHLAAYLVLIRLLTVKLF